MNDSNNYDYDLFVIGAGSGGIRSAKVANDYGKKVGLAEVAYFGGTCVNVGCVPKKLMVYASGFKKSFEDAQSYGWETSSSPKFNWQKFIKAKNNEINRLTSSKKERIKGFGIDVYDEYAVFEDEHKIKLGNKIISAEKILIATGGTPFVLDIPGKEHFITSEQAFFIEKLPKDIIIIGGGYIGVEFAYIFHGMGANVTIMNRSNTLLKSFDHEIQTALIEDMKNKNIKLELGDTPSQLKKNGDEITVKTESGKSLNTNMIMCATGRIPNTKDLGLDKAGVKYGASGNVIVNSEFQTNIDNIYALGDVANKVNLTPVAIREGQAIMDHIFGNMEFNHLDYNKVATAVFSQPPIGAVGITEQEAKKQNIDYAIYRAKFRPMKNTISGRVERAIMKVIVERKSDKILGFHMMGDDAAEIIQLAATILVMDGTKSDLDKTVAIHPTSAEEFVLMRSETTSNL